MPLLLLKLSNHPLLALNPCFSVEVHGSLLTRSAYKYFAFSQIKFSVTVSPASCFSFIHTRSNFSTSSRTRGHCFDTLVTPFAASSAFISSFFFNSVQIVDVDFL